MLIIPWLFGEIVYGALLHALLLMNNNSKLTFNTYTLIKWLSGNTSLRYIKNLQIQEAVTI
jgi:hypothetical protein